MFTILGADGKEYGPVTADKIIEWIGAGRANLQTRARREGETEWKTLGEFAEFTQATAAAPAPAPLAPVPVAPAASTGSTGTAAYTTINVEAKAYAEDLLSRAQPLDVFGCLGRAFDLWKAHLLPLVGATFVICLISMALGFVPLLGALANFLLTGVFYGGLYYYYLGKMRGQPREFGDAFAGFNRGFGPLMIASILTVLITAVVAGILIVPIVVAMIATAGDTGPNLLFVPFICLASLPVLYLHIGWLFAFALIIDKGLGPWTAMEVSRRVITRYWFRVFFVALLGGILAMLGLIGFIIGIFFTLPIAIAAILYAYEDLCNPPPRA